LGSAAIIGEMVSAMTTTERENTALIMTDVQMLQPLITLFVSGLFFDEAIGLLDFTVCLLLIGIVLYCRRTPFSNAQ
jgi:drug/metabolite transporter (DMT)-like permease